MKIRNVDIELERTATGGLRIAIGASAIQPPAALVITLTEAQADETWTALTAVLAGPDEVEALLELYRRRGGDS